MHDGALAVILALTVAFNIVAGFNDGGNLLAAAAASRTIAPAVAFIVIVAGAFAGPLLWGTAVAATIGTGVVDFTRLGPAPLIAGIAGAIATILVAYTLRFPTSATLALIAATIGGLWVGHGLAAIKWTGIVKVLISLLVSPVAGFLTGFIVYAIVLALLSGVSRRTGDRMMKLQYATIGLQAFGYGANDAEKMMGLMAAGLIVGGASGRFAIPLWVIAAAIGAFAIGMAWGGLRVAKTVGGKLFAIRPIHALSFQAAAAATVLTASALGGPLSTTETTASAIIGVGAGANPRALHWRIVREFGFVWLFTVPAALTLGGAAALALRAVR